MKIYALMWGELVLYVGKTERSLKVRATAHRSQANNTCSRYIPDYMDWEIVLVDQVPDEEGTKWEQYYYDELMPLYNYCRPGQTHGESSKAYGKKTGYAAQMAYQKTDKHKAYLRAYYQANKEAYAKRQRKYRAAS
jgi:hypothetical protein